MRCSQAHFPCRSNQGLGLPICEVGAVWPTLPAAVRRQWERLSLGLRQAWVCLHGPLLAALQGERLPLKCR